MPAPRDADGVLTAAGQAFGLTIESEVALPLAPGVASRSVVVRRSRLEAAPWDGAHRPVESRLPDGSLFLSVDFDPRRGLRIAAPTCGTHVVSPDGREIVVGEGEADTTALLLAQSLPTAAALQGLDPIHASAVAADGGVEAYSAPSGLGKSTAAAMRLGEGARLVTDDVLALEMAPDGGVVAHPGPRRMRLDADAHARLPLAARDALGGVTGTDDGKLTFAPIVVAGPRRLRELVLLVPADSSPSSSRAQLLLGTAYVPHVQIAARLQARLEIVAAIDRAGIAVSRRAWPD